MVGYQFGLTVIKVGKINLDLFALARFQSAKIKMVDLEFCLVNSHESRTTCNVS